MAQATSQAAPQVIDRVAVVVRKTIITESEIVQDLHLTEFMNGEPRDDRAAARRAAAERLVDQQLLRNEMNVTHFAAPPASDAGQLLYQFKKRFRSDTEYRAALQRYGITEDELKQQLLWQVAVMRFTDFRFKSEVPPPTNEGADRAAAPNTIKANANAPKGSSKAPAPESVDQQMETWLKEARTNNKVTFKTEAFQ